MKRTKVLNPGAPVGCERLRKVRFSYLNFAGEIQTNGELVVMDAVADHVLKIFDALRSKSFPIAKAQLMDYYSGDDEASMLDNNTSALNDRKIAGRGPISIHAYGLAIDINPVQNPFIRRSNAAQNPLIQSLSAKHAKDTASISPKSGSEYEDRKNLRPGMAEGIVDIFADHGFLIWGGRWSNPTDYQHFQVSRTVATELSHASPVVARALFESTIEQYRKCRLELPAGANRKSCIVGTP